MASGRDNGVDKASEIQSKRSREIGEVGARVATWRRTSGCGDVDTAWSRSRQGVAEDPRC